MTLQCLHSMCVIYLVLLLYCMEKMGLLFVLGGFSLLSSSFCVVYFSALLNAVIMLSCVYPRSRFRTKLMHACLPDSMTSIYIWSDNLRPKSAKRKLTPIAIPIRSGIYVRIRY